MHNLLAIFGLGLSNFSPAPLIEWSDFSRFPVLLTQMRPSAQRSAITAVSDRIADGIDPGLMADIMKIRAIDNHAHPMKVVLKGEKLDEDYDALPVDAMQPFDLPARIRPDNHLFIEAWRELFGYAYHDMSREHLKNVLERKLRKTREHGDGYCAWVLDRLGIETQLANRVAMGRGLSGTRFRWVPFADALLFPLDNRAAKRRNSEYASMYAGRSSDPLSSQHSMMTTMRECGAFCAFSARIAETAAKTA